MNVILFDSSWESLLPITYTRPVAEIRMGILTLKEKWEKRFGFSCSCLTEDYLSTKFPAQFSDDNLFVNANILATDELFAVVEQLKLGEALVKDEKLIAVRLSQAEATGFTAVCGTYKKQITCPVELDELLYPEQIFSKNSTEIKRDFELLTAGRSSAPIPTTNRVLCPDNIFVEAGASVNFAVLNATDGPIYIGKDAEIMEGALVKGPFALCEHAVVKMGAKVYADSTFGPYSKVGGETGNVVITGYSNKGHDGYLGNAVLGEWCNLGADTNNSNLKNDYMPVKIWDYKKKGFRATGLQFCGTIMGDHSKTGINTMLNTGTVIGVSANVFGAGFPRQFVPSFSWGGAAGFKEYLFAKAIKTGELMMKRRAKAMDEVEQNILKHVFERSAVHRNC